MRVSVLELPGNVDGAQLPVLADDVDCGRLYAQRLVAPYAHNPVRVVVWLRDL